MQKLFSDLESETIYNIPGTAATDIPPGMKSYFHGQENSGMIWNVHLDENDQTRTLDQSVYLLLEKLESVPDDTAITLRWHSLGARLIMHAVIQSPQVLSKIHRIQLVVPPPSHTGFAESKLFKIIQKKNPNIVFTPEYLTSLEKDTLDINAEFGKTLQRNDYTGMLEVFADPNDSFLTILDPQYREHMREFADIISPMTEWFLQRQWEKAFPKVKLHHINVGHNFEEYRLWDTRTIENILDFTGRWVSAFLDWADWPDNTLATIKELQKRYPEKSLEQILIESGIHPY